MMFLEFGLVGFFGTFFTTTSFPGWILQPPEIKGYL